MFRNSDGWYKKYQSKGALWVYDGATGRPHALLTSGNHSDGFFNSELVLEDPSLLDEATADLVELLRQDGLSPNEVGRVVGPAMGAITLAHDIARHIARQQTSCNVCFSAFTEKDVEGEEKIMVFRKSSIRRGERVLLTEDVLTTGGSVELTSRAANKAGCTMLPFVAVLVNRSGLTEVDGRKIIALIERPISTWKPEDCPLCKQGSQPLRPKETRNWRKLIAK